MQKKRSTGTVLNQMEKEEKGKKSKTQFLWIGSEHNEKPVPACVEDHLSTRLVKQAPCWCQGYSAKLKDCVSACV